MLRVVLALALAVGLSSFAKAADTAAKTKKTPEEIFKAINTSGDGKMTLDEYKASIKKHIKDETKQTAALDKAEARFKKMDTDGDGKVSLDEFTAAQAKNKGKGKHKPKN